MLAVTVSPWARFSLVISAASSKLSGRMPTMTLRPTSAVLSACCSSPLTGKSPTAVRSMPSSRVPAMKFIAGEPMNPATNRLAGRS
jgi:hypothetical protein